MPDELNMCPFERSIEGLRGTVLLRRNHDHAKRCTEAIRRRGALPWSTLHAEIVDRTEKVAA
jgi:hypothetical protein